MYHDLHDLRVVVSRIQVCGVECLELNHSFVRLLEPAADDGFEVLRLGGEDNLVDLVDLEAADDLEVGELTGCEVSADESVNVRRACS
jgi:hypothetical protein